MIWSRCLTYQSVWDLWIYMGLYPCLRTAQIVQYLMSRFSIYYSRTRKQETMALLGPYNLLTYLSRVMSIDTQLLIDKYTNQSSPVNTNQIRKVCTTGLTPVYPMEHFGGCVLDMSGYLVQSSDVWYNMFIHFFHLSISRIPTPIHIKVISCLVPFGSQCWCFAKAPKVQFEFRFHHSFVLFRFGW